MENTKLLAKGIFIVIFGILELLFFSAIFYGFNALIPAYKSMKVYDYLCYKTLLNETVQSQSCIKQDNMLGYAVISWTCFDFSCSIFVGAFFDRFGIRKSKLLAAICFLTGCLLFAFTSSDYPHLLFPAGLVLSISCQTLIMANLQVGYIFPAYRTIIQGFASGAVSCSSLPFTLMYLINGLGVKLRDIFIVYAIVGSAVIIVSSLFLMKSTPIEMIKLGKKLQGESSKNVQLNVKEINLKKEVEINGSPCKEMLSSCEMTGERKRSDENMEIQKLDEVQFMKSLYPTVRSCFMSKYYLTHLIFAAFTILRYTYFFSGLNSVLETSFSEDKTMINQLLQSFNYITFSGIIVAPTSGIIIDYLRSRIKVDSLTPERIYSKNLRALVLPHIISCTAFILTSCLIFIRSSVAVYTSYMFFVIGRTFFLSFININLLTAFPVENFGKLKGITSLFCGIFSILQYAILELYNANKVGGNILLIVICFVPLIHPIAIHFIHSKNVRPKVTSSR